MKKLYLTIIICLLSVMLNAQSKQGVDPNKPKFLVEIPASFPGGRDAMDKYIQKNIKHSKGPEQKTKAACTVSFVIEIDGTLTNLKLDRATGECKECNEEAIRLVSSMPKWTPAKDKGKIVRSSNFVSVRFTSKEGSNNLNKVYKGE